MKNVAVFWGLGVDAHWTKTLSRYVPDVNFYNFNLHEIELIHNEENSRAAKLFFNCDYIIVHSLASFLLKKNYSRLFKKIIAFDPNSIIQEKELSFTIARYFKRNNIKAIKKTINQVSLACNGSARWKEYAINLDPDKLGNICNQITEEFYLNQIRKNLLKKNVLVFKSNAFSIHETISTQKAPKHFNHLPMIESPRNFSIFLESILNDE